jgi:hypothetical protein
MPGPKSKSLAPMIDRMLDEASWLLSHADALAGYGRQAESLAELARAAICEEQVACLLEADAQDSEAAIHRVSAASCHEKLGQSARAATLLRAALSADLPGEYRTRVEQQRIRCLAQARKELSRLPARGSRKPVSAMPAS